jgi:hypothetical protein
MAINTDSQSAVTVILAMIYLVLILSIGIYVSNKMTLKGRRCRGLEEKVYPNLDKFITNISDDDAKYPLRDYYIKTAYNCCAVGIYKNSYVDLCALNACLGQGNRCLDMEIYSIKGAPAVAVSSLKDFNIKESYNSIPLSDVFQHLQDNAFSAGACPNPADPLFLNLRIKSDHKEINDKIAGLIYTHFESLVMGPEYSYENHQHNFSEIPLKEMRGKVIIMVDKTINSLYQQSKLDEYVNIAGGGRFMNSNRYYDIKYTYNSDDIINFNKYNMTIVLPDLSPSDANFNAALPQKYGCQFIAMAVQEMDEYLEKYDVFFGEAGHAFVLKPPDLRPQTEYVGAVKPLPPDQSLQPRHADTVVGLTYKI